MKVHISLNVNDINKSVEFYSKMLGSEPAKLITADGAEVEVPGSGTDAVKPKTGYAKFDITDPPLNLALNETATSAGGTLSHLGLQVDSSEKVLDFKKRWEEAGLVTADEMDVTCCYARQDKTWVQDPDGNEWEAFVVLENVESMNPAEASCCDGDFVEKVQIGVQVEKADAGTRTGCC